MINDSQQPDVAPATLPRRKMINDNQSQDAMLEAGWPLHLADLAAPAEHPAAPQEKP